MFNIYFEGKIAREFKKTFSCCSIFL